MRDTDRKRVRGWDKEIGGVGEGDGGIVGKEEREEKRVGSDSVRLRV